MPNEPITDDPTIKEEFDKEIEESSKRYGDLPPPEVEMTIQEWRKIVGALFPDCMSAGEVGIAVVSQLLIKDIRNPFGLVYVDVPSAGKTITLNFFSDIEELVCLTDSFTPASLVSHASNRKREDLEKIDLLPRIRHKVLVVRDFAPIFAERQESLLKNLGVMTRVFDGEGYESDSGVHGKRGYKGDYNFMFLAGSTPIHPRVWKTMGGLGNRLFFLNMKALDKSEEELADLLVQDDLKQKEQMCRRATRNLILSIWTKYKEGVDWDKNNDEFCIRQIVSRCAMLLARLRGSINVCDDDGEGTSGGGYAVIEKPLRINQLLYNFARGHALGCGRVNIGYEDLWSCVDIALNSAQQNRIQFIEALIKFNGSVNTKIIEEVMKCSNTTALKIIDTMQALGIVCIQSGGDIRTGRPEKIAVLVEDLAWFASDECKMVRAMRPKPNNL